MQQALEQHEYKVTIIEDAKWKTPLGELIIHLQEFLEDCTEMDTVIFYFAGHSLNDGRTFKFILADDINHRKNQLPVTMLLPLLQECRAANKVLIFDCCRSGKVAVDYNWRGDAGEWCRIFTATSSKETAMEVDENTGGGLFTSWIYRALTSEAAKLADDDGYVRINRLGRHIKTLADNYRSPSGRLAPVPHLYDSTSKDIALTKKIIALPTLNTGYPRSFISELKSLLVFPQPSVKQIRECFDYCHCWSNPKILYPVAYKSGDLNDILEYFAGLYYQKSNDLPLPLVSFIAHLSEMLDNLPELTAWLDRLTEWLGRQAAISSEHLADARRDKGPAVSTQTPYLMVEIEPLRNSSSYHVYCYVQNSLEEQWPLRVDDEEIVLSAVPSIVIRELNNIPGLSPYLELILPKVLLTDNETLRSWEQWTTDSNEQSRPLGVEYPLSLRCRERLRETERHKKCGCDHLMKYWEKYYPCFGKPPVRCCADWLTNDKKHDFIDYIHSNDPFLGLLFPPHPIYLEALLNAGVAIVLWPRQENLNISMQDILGQFFSRRPLHDLSKKLLNRKLRKLLDQYFSRHALRELPEALRKVREKVFIESKGTQTVDLSLLWDDPNRKPDIDTSRLKFPA